MLRPPLALPLLLLPLTIVFAACGTEDVAAPPPPEVSVVEVLQRDQPIRLEMVGETRGSADIPIRARVEGVLEAKHFVEGRGVEKGALLYEIDPQPFRARVAEAKGRLAEAVTALAKAKADLGRIEPLAEMKAVSQQDLDAARAQYEAALGARQAARAQVEQAEIELGYTKIHAPISGRIGISEAEVGEFVGRVPNPVVLNTISKTDPIRVRFAIDERRYLQLARSLRAREAAQVEAPARSFELILADGSEYEHRGRPTGADAAIDPSTGTFTMEADFPNPDEIVLAGQFARVRAVAETLPDALLVPRRSVTELQGNFRVFVVAADGSVELRPVELGPVVDSLQVVTKGLQAGERVAYEGVQRLRAGAQVTPTLVALDASGLPAVAAGGPEAAAPAEATDPPGS
ncbi:MAG: efflux RND transporter periplasmic adaptor subunit [Myxococcota bacterium]